MEVKTKSIFEPASEKDGIRFLITRYYPRGVKKDHFDDWQRVLSPSPKLLFEFKDGKIDWETFTQRFVIELASSTDAVEVINALHDEMKRDDITLLCFEQNGKPCHRRIVRDLIEKPQKLPLVKASS